MTSQSSAKGHVFITKNRNLQSNLFTSTYPFPAIDFSDSILEDLSTAFEIETIPVFMIFDKYGNLIETNGRMALQGKTKKSPEEIIKKWMEKSRKYKSQ